MYEVTNEVWCFFSKFVTHVLLSVLIVILCRENTTPLS